MAKSSTCTDASKTVAVMPAALAHEALEALEDAQDLAAIKAAREEGGEPIPWEQVKAELAELEAEGR